MQTKVTDLTSGSLVKRILQFVIPLSLTGILQQTFTTVDVAVVGRFAGTEAMAAVGANAAFISLLLNLFLGISLGSTMVIARAIGRRDLETARRAVHSSIVVAVAAGVVVGAISALFAGQVVAALDTPVEIAPYAVRYLRIYLVGLPVIVLYNFAAAVFRSVGNTRIPLVTLTISGVLNVGLNLLFVLGFHMDVDGVAIATVLSNLVSAGILTWYLVNSREESIRLELRRLRVHTDVLKEILRIGLPAGLQHCMLSIANLSIQAAIDSLGTTVIAGSSAGFNVEITLGHIFSSYGQACATFTSQNQGAGRHDRCRQVLKLCIVMDLIATVVTYSLVITFSRKLVGLFSTDPAVVEVGMTRLVYIFFCNLGSCLSDPCSGYLRGYGISTPPAVCSVVGIVGVRLGWIATVFRASRTFGTLMMAYPVSLAVTATMHLVLTLWLRPGKKAEMRACNGA